MSFWKNISDFTMEVIAPVLTSDDENEAPREREKDRNDEVSFPTFSSIKKLLDNNTSKELNQKIIPNSNPSENTNEQIIDISSQEPLVSQFKRINRNYVEKKRNSSQNNQIIQDDQDQIDKEVLSKNIIDPSTSTTESTAKSTIETNSEIIKENKTENKTENISVTISNSQEVSEDSNPVQKDELDSKPSEGSQNYTESNSSTINEVSESISNQNEIEILQSNVLSFFINTFTKSSSPIHDLQTFTPTNSQEAELADILLHLTIQYTSLKLSFQQALNEKIRIYEDKIIELRNVLKLQFEKYENDVQRYQQEIQQSNTDLQNLRLERQKTNRLLEEHQQSFTEQKRSLSQLSLDAQEEAEYYRKELQKEQVLKESLNTTILELKQQLDRQEQSYKKLATDYEALESGIEDMELDREKEITALKNKTNILEHSLLEYQTQISEFQQLDSKYNSLQSNYNKLSMDLKSTQTAFLSSQKRNQSLENILDNMITRINDDTFIDRKLMFLFLKEYFSQIHSENHEDYFDNLANYLRLNQDQRNELWGLFHSHTLKKSPIIPPNPEIQGKSLSELWVNFLYNQSQKGK